MRRFGHLADERFALRRCISARDGSTYRFGSFELSADERVILRTGAAVALAPKAIAVLLELAKHAGQIIDKRVLLEMIWPDTYVEEANLTQTIYVLRSFLKENDCGVTIENIPKRGYCLHVAAPSNLAPESVAPHAFRKPLRIDRTQRPAECSRGEPVVRTSARNRFKRRGLVNNRTWIRTTDGVEHRLHS